jgi:hypothetical protein
MTVDWMSATPFVRAMDAFVGQLDMEKLGRSAGRNRISALLDSPQFGIAEEDLGDSST